MRHSPGERGPFRVQSPGFRWVSVSGRHPGEAVGQGAKQPQSLLRRAKPCAFPPQPSSWRLLCHLPLPAMGDEETWLAAIACCLPSASPSRWLSGPLPAPTVSLGLACPGDLAPVITWAPSPALSLLLSLL